MLDALLSWDGWTVTQLPAEQAAIFRLEGAPPSEEFPFIQESEALEILFCRKGGLILEWAGHRRLSLSADQVLFRSHSMVPLFGWKRKPRGRPCVLCTPTWESPSPVPGMILVC